MIPNNPLNSENVLPQKSGGYAWLNPLFNAKPLGHMPSDL